MCMHAHTYYKFTTNRVMSKTKTIFYLSILHSKQITKGKNDYHYNPRYPVERSPDGFF